MLKFNNKILLLIVVLSVVIGLLLANNIEMLKNYKTVTCIVIFFTGLMTYNGLLKAKEEKLKKEKENKSDQEQENGAETESKNSKKED